MSTPWNVLIVDDEEDVHSVTTLALKRRSWRGRAISLKSARSGKEARALLESPTTPHFHCAIVDVVMETNDAGLQLCDFIRSTLPRTMRVVLRTGQPGAAPPEKVLNDYDIDYYLAKTDVTDERLFAVVRACLRSSLDIGALLAVTGQLRGFTLALQNAQTTREGLVKIMLESLGFLESKYSAKIAFVDDTRHPSAALPSANAEAVATAIATAVKQGATPLSLLEGAAFNLGAKTFVCLPTVMASDSRLNAGLGERVKRWFQNVMTESEPRTPEAGVVIELERDESSRILGELQQDLELLFSNWTLADGALRAQDKMVSQRMEMLKHLGSAS